jgi:ankyrin repeat protein
MVLSLSLLVAGQAGSSGPEQYLFGNCYLPQVQTALQNGANVNATRYGASILMFDADNAACSSEVVKLLLEKGAKIEAKDSEGRTALFIAANRGNTDVVKLLLEKGANIDVKNTVTGETALHMAAVRGNVEIVMLLLEKGGANIEAKDIWGNTPLIRAALDGQTEVVKLLLERGANTKVKNNDGQTALTAATSKGKTGVVQLLEGRGSQKAIPEEARSIPARAESASPQDTLNQYVADLQKNPNDIALREKIIALALTMNPSPEVSAEAKRHMSRGVAVVEGAKTSDDFNDACNEFRQVNKLAPWLANGYRNLAIAQDKAGMYEEALANLRLYLLTKPAPSDVDWAEDLKSKVEYRKGKAEMGQELATALGQAHADLARVQALINNGADVNAKNGYGMTMLFAAANNDNVDIVRALIDKGADVNARCNDGDTPLMVAKRTDIARLLINKGANVNARSDRDGRTVLMHSLAYLFSAGNPDVVRMLIDSGADVNAKDNNGKTALWIVEGGEVNNPEIARILRAAGAR